LLLQLDGLRKASTIHATIMRESSSIQSEDLGGFRGVILGVLHQAHLGFEGARQLIMLTMESTGLTLLPSSAPPTTRTRVGRRPAGRPSGGTGRRRRAPGPASAGIDQLEAPQHGGRARLGGGGDGR
jgi:hypothetical protein